MRSNTMQTTKPNLQILSGYATDLLHAIQ